MKGRVRRRRKQSTQLPFPQILFSILEQADQMGYSHIISWSSHGRSFVVHDRQAFVEHVLPIYFSQTKYASFQRQLNLYGFQHTHGRGKDDTHVYGHERFRRDRPTLLDGILRGLSGTSGVSAIPLGRPLVAPQHSQAQETPAGVAPAMAADSHSADHNATHTKARNPGVESTLTLSRPTPPPSLPQEPAHWQLSVPTAHIPNIRSSVPMDASISPAIVNSGGICGTNRSQEQPNFPSLEATTGGTQTSINDEVTFYDLVRSTEELLRSIHEKHFSDTNAESRNVP